MGGGGVEGSGELRESSHCSPALQKESNTMYRRKDAVTLRWSELSTFCVETAGWQQGGVLTL